MCALVSGLDNDAGEFGSESRIELRTSSSTPAANAGAMALRLSSTSVSVGPHNKKTLSAPSIAVLSDPRSARWPTTVSTHRGKESALSLERTSARSGSSPAASCSINADPICYAPDHQDHSSAPPIMSRACSL